MEFHHTINFATEHESPKITVSHIRLHLPAVMFTFKLTGLLVPVSVGDARKPAAAHRTCVLLDLQVDSPVVQDKVRHGVRS